jgi:hypothetical protein
VPIIDVTEVLADLKKRNPGIEVREYLFRRLFSEEKRVFFDCSGVAEVCLSEVLAHVGFSRFVAYSVVEDASGQRVVLDVSYTALDGETLERFVRRYPGQLKPSSEMALQLSNRRYVEYIGAGYED